MRLPRDLSGDDLIELLRSHFGYRFLRQRGSHARVGVDIEGNEHRVTIPRHQQKRVGTLNSVLTGVAEHFGLTRDDVRQQLFGK